MKRLICYYGDDRQKASVNNKKRRSFESGDRHPDRKKTLHVYFEAEGENIQADGSMSSDQKCVSSNTKSTYLNVNTNSSVGNSRCNSVSNKPTIVKYGRKKWSKRRRIYSSVTSTSVNSSLTTEETDVERNSLTLFLIRILRTFKRNKTSIKKNQQLSSMQPASFETHVTAASTTFNAYDVISEHDQEQHELKSFANELHSETAELHESLL